MSCIVYQTDKKTGIKYAYESFSYWDKEKKQPRSTRKYLGRVDEETGEIVPTRKQKVSTITGDVNVGTTPATEKSPAFSMDEIRQKDSQIQELRREVAKLHREKADLAAALEKIVSSGRVKSGSRLVQDEDFTIHVDRSRDSYHLLYCDGAGTELLSGGCGDVERP